MSQDLRVALIGFGAIGQQLAALIRQNLNGVTIVGVATRAAPRPQDIALLPQGARCVRRPEDFAALEFDLAIECAGHAALGEFGPQVLRQGRDLLIASVGALADRAVESELRLEAERSHARLLIPAGALGGLDVLSAARLGGLETVTYIGRKPVHAWRGTRAEKIVDLDDDSKMPALLFAGTARQAAREFPQNANAAAAVALAGLGFDRTRVQLIVDRGLGGNEHRISAQGQFGSFEITVCANALPDNPRSSLLAPCSLARCVANLRSAVALA
jgi:aspartate dehydrogenase